MANPQVEHGHIRLANQLDEALTVAPFNVTQAKIVRLIARLTYGWKRRTVRISQVDLAEKIRLKASSGAWRQAFALLIDEGVVVEVEPPIGRRPGAYALNKNFERWGRYSVPRAFLEAHFNERPDQVDDVQRAIARLRAASTETPQTDLDFQANSGQETPPNEDRSLSSGGQSTDESDDRSLSSTGQSNPRSLSSSGVLPVHQRRGGSPPEDSQIPTNSNNGNGIGGGESNRKQEKTSSRKERAAAAAVGSTEYESRIVEAAALAIRRRFPDHALSGRHAADLVEAFVALDIPVDFAVDAIRTAAARKLGDPPASIAWFRSRVLDLWRDREHEIVKHGSEGPPTVRKSMDSPAPLADLVDPGIASAREQYAAAKRASAIAWGKDPANAADYRLIVEAANAEFAAMIDHTWGQRARDLSIITRCVEAAPFVSFADWMTERNRTGHSSPYRDDDQ